MGDIITSLEQRESPRESREGRGEGEKNTVGMKITRKYDLTDIRTRTYVCRTQPQRGLGATDVAQFYSRVFLWWQLMGMCQTADCCSINIERRPTSSKTASNSRVRAPFPNSCASTGKPATFAKESFTAHAQILIYYQNKAYLCMLTCTFKVLTYLYANVHIYTYNQTCK